MPLTADLPDAEPTTDFRYCEPKYYPSPEHEDYDLRISPHEGHPTIELWLAGAGLRPGVYTSRDKASLYVVDPDELFGAFKTWHAAQLTWRWSCLLYFDNPGGPGHSHPTYRLPDTPANGYRPYNPWDVIIHPSEPPSPSSSASESGSGSAGSSEEPHALPASVTTRAPFGDRKRKARAGTEPCEGRNKRKAGASLGTAAFRNLVQVAAATVSLRQAQAALAVAAAPPEPTPHTEPALVVDASAPLHAAAQAEAPTQAVPRPPDRAALTEVATEVVPAPPDAHAPAPGASKANAIFVQSDTEESDCELVASDESDVVEGSIILTDSDDEDGPEYPPARPLASGSRSRQKADPDQHMYPNIREANHQTQLANLVYYCVKKHPAMKQGVVMVDKLDAERLYKQLQGKGYNVQMVESMEFEDIRRFMLCLDKQN
ncbi:hypothetical protein HGRIS_005403 [Hohenbuehelia grisea]|uniref:Uncharacterized protein n=1 Tax=Hohenbuehelia grisea TaxID=104357 RepID=A0ABR3JEW4_9AGAR